MRGTSGAVMFANQDGPCCHIPMAPVRRHIAVQGVVGDLFGPIHQRRHPEWSLQGGTFCSSAIDFG